MECPSPPPRVFYDKIVTAVAQGSSHSTEPSPTACTSVATACGIHDAAASGPHPASGVRILHRMEEAVFDGRRDSALRDRANVSMSQGGSGGANIEKLRAVCALYDEMFPDILGPAIATAASTQGQGRTAVLRPRLQTASLPSSRTTTRAGGPRGSSATIPRTTRRTRRACVRRVQSTMCCSASGRGPSDAGEALPGPHLRLLSCMTMTMMRMRLKGAADSASVPSSRQRGRQ